MVSDILGFVFVTAVGLNIFGGIPASIWVIYDYKKLQMYKYKCYDGIITTAIGCLLFCIACLPWYCRKRRAILNGTARLHLKYAKEPPPLYVKPSLPLKDSAEDKLRLMEKDVLLSSGMKFTTSKLLRAAFLSLNIKHEETLINALKNGCLSSSAAKLIYAAFHLLAAHYANGRKEIPGTCYMVYHPPIPKEENNTEHLLTRLELLAEAGRKKQINPKTYNKLYLQVASALDDAVIQKYPGILEEENKESEKVIAEAAITLSEIALTAPPGWAVYESEDSNGRVCDAPDQWQPPPLGRFESVAIRNITKFERMIHEVENEWGIHLDGENDIHSYFIEVTSNPGIRFHMQDFSEYVFDVLEKSGKIPQGDPGESIEERYAILLEGAKIFISNILGLSIAAHNIDPKTKLSKIGTVFQCLKIYDRLQNSRGNNRIVPESIWGRLFSLISRFFDVPKYLPSNFVYVFIGILPALVLADLLDVGIGNIGVFLTISMIFCMAMFFRFMFKFISKFFMNLSFVIDSFVMRNQIPTLENYVRKVAKAQYCERGREIFSLRFHALLYPILDSLDLNENSEFAEPHVVPIDMRVGYERDD